MYFVLDNGDRAECKEKISTGSGSTFAYGVLDAGWRHDLSVDEAVELGKRAIYHAQHRDGASGGVCRVYHIHEKGWTKKIAGEDATKMHWEYAASKGLQGHE